MQIEVLFFATLRDLAGQKKTTISLPMDKATVRDVRTNLIETFPNLEANLKVALVAINDDFAFDDDAVNNGDEVAFFPPVSGGSDDKPEICLLLDKAVDHDEIVASITTPATGAVCLFSGMVRGKTSKEGHLQNTEYLEYEAYESMALAKMRQVAQEIRKKYPLVEGIAIAQRIGKLTIGQNTVLIACSSGHRDDGCFEAARYGIDRLKEIVPVWKKEVGADGETWIEGDYVPKPTDRTS